MREIKNSTLTLRVRVALRFVAELVPAEERGTRTAASRQPELLSVGFYCPKLFAPPPTVQSRGVRRYFRRSVCVAQHRDSESLDCPRVRPAFLAPKSSPRSLVIVLEVGAFT